MKTPVKNIEIDLIDQTGMIRWAMKDGDNGYFAVDANGVKGEKLDKTPFSLGNGEYAILLDKDADTFAEYFAVCIRIKTYLGLPRQMELTDKRHQLLIAFISNTKRCSLTEQEGQAVLNYANYSGKEKELTAAVKIAVAGKAQKSATRKFSFGG